MRPDACCLAGKWVPIMYSRICTGKKLLDSETGTMLVSSTAACTSWLRPLDAGPAANEEKRHSVHAKNTETSANLPRWSRRLERAEHVRPDALSFAAWFQFTDSLISHHKANIVCNISFAYIVMWPFPKKKNYYEWFFAGPYYCTSNTN